MTDWTALRKELLGERESVLPPDVKMPMLPKAVTEFTERAADPEASGGELGKIVESDAGLTCELLKYVNSSAVGLRRPANSATHAIALLGIAKVKLFVVTTAIQRAMTSRDSKLVNAQTFWNVNLERALFSRKLAELMKVDPDLAFAGGMLQDFLLPILTSEQLDDYVDFCSGQDKQPVNLVDFENDRLTWDHAFAAAQMTYDWGLPDDLICCIALHHLGPDVLRDQRYRTTSVAAVAIGAMMPDPLRQVPGGLDVLRKLEAAWPAFDLLAVADAVAEEFAELAPTQVSRHRTMAQRVSAGRTNEGDEATDEPGTPVTMQVGGDRRNGGDRRAVPRAECRT